MTTPKLLAGGAAAVLAVGGGALAHSLIASPGSATARAPQASPATRPVANDPTARQVYDAAKGAVAYISAALPQGQATGSGFVVSQDGLVVTDHHVIEGASQVTVKVGTDATQRSAQVVADDAAHDLALLKVDTGGAQLPTLSLGDSSRVGVGDGTYAIGSPFGLDETLTTGIVSALNRDLQSPSGATISGAIQTDAAINPGNSGGPLLDGGGKVIGVNAQIATASQSGGGGSVGIGFAIPSNAVKQFLADAKAGKDAPQQDQGQVDPNGAQQQTAPDGQPVDPYGQQADPNAQQQSDPYSQPQADPYGGLAGG